MSKSKSAKRGQFGLGGPLFGTPLGEIEKREPTTGSDLFIVDNSDSDWKVMRYLLEWADIAHSFDIATGFFEIGALLALDGQWQKLDNLRILMGDTTSKRTRNALLEGINQVLNASIEKEKEINDFLHGVPAIVQAIASKQIQCKVYTKEKFHAKAYITHAKQAVVGSSALVGSSNFTTPGLTTNVELNVQLRREVEILQDWYERHWKAAEEISNEILKAIERHIREYSPLEVYAKSLQEFFRGHEITAGEWEKTGSQLYPRLDQYQKEGYQVLLKIANQYGGAFLCDGVGLGKTLIGLMLIERFVMYDRKRVALIVPKAARKPVWEKHIERYTPDLGIVQDFSNLSIFNHTDLLRGGEFSERLKRIKELADVIIIDEAHHFRNPGVIGKSRYWQLYDICKGKTVFFLTATPVNNSLRDLQHMMELFTQRESGYFRTAPLGIHSLPGHFLKLEKDLEQIILTKVDKDDILSATNQTEAEKVLFNDNLFQTLVVQRSRAYVKKSQEQHGGSSVIFPKREDPKVVDYSIKKTYGNLLNMIEAAFAKEKPLFSLAMYYPLYYYKGPDTTIDPFEENRQKQLVRLIRILFLKRFESSAQAFEMSCHELLLKMLTFITKHVRNNGEKRRLERWKAQNDELIAYVQAKQSELFPDKLDEENEDIITAEMLGDIEELSRDDYKVEEILEETYLDLNEVVDFISELKKFRAIHDDKLKALVKLLKTDPVLKEHKVIIFTEFMTTAHYLKKELENAGILGLDEVDSSDKRDRGDVITQFAPYYNGISSKELANKRKKETRVLISTDVLSEGLNLQDATRLINYDLHWNPVRLMQRIGRVDRRLDPHIEQIILADHPEQKTIRGSVAYWNFLPPEELEVLLRLYSKVSHKTLRISKVFGIEGKKLLTPRDDFDALKDFLHQYEGAPTTVEEMRLEFQKLLQDNPELEERLNVLPGRVFSGKQHPSPDAKAVFFCYSLPAPQIGTDKLDEEIKWTEEAGYTQWYLYDIASEKTAEGPEEIISLIRSTSQTPRYRSLSDETLSEIRQKMENHIKNSYFKKVQAPIGIKATLKAWMELS